MITLVLSRDSRLPPEVRRVRKSRKKGGVAARLPLEVIRYIGGFLPTGALAAACLLNRQWNHGMFPVLWRTIPATAFNSEYFLCQMIVNSRLTSALNIHLHALPPAPYTPTRPNSKVFDWRGLKSISFLFTNNSNDSFSSPLRPNTQLACQLLSVNSNNLVKLSITWMPCTSGDSILRAIADIRTLEHLTLRSWSCATPLDQRALVKILHSCSALTTLALVEAMGFHARHPMNEFNNIAFQTNIHTLHLDKSYIQSQLLVSLSRCMARLRNLHLTGAIWPEPPVRLHADVASQLATFRANCPLIEYIDISNMSSCSNKVTAVFRSYYESMFSSSNKVIKAKNVIVNRTSLLKIIQTDRPSLLTHLDLGHPDIILNRGRPIRGDLAFEVMMILQTCSHLEFLDVSPFPVDALRFGPFPLAVTRLRTLKICIELEQEWVWERVNPCHEYMLRRECPSAPGHSNNNQQQQQQQQHHQHNHGIMHGQGQHARYQNGSMLDTSMPSTETNVFMTILRPSITHIFPNHMPSSAPPYVIPYDVVTRVLTEAQSQGRPKQNSMLLHQAHAQPYPQVHSQAQAQALAHAREQLYSQVYPHAQAQAQAQAQTHPQAHSQGHPHAQTQVQPQPLAQLPAYPPAEAFAHHHPQLQINPQFYPQANSQAHSQSPRPVHSHVRPQAQPQTQPQTRQQAQPQVQPQVQPQAQSQAQPQIQPQTRPQTQPQAPPQAPTHPKRCTHSRAQDEAQREADAQESMSASSGNPWFHNVFMRLGELQHLEHLHLFRFDPVETTPYASLPPKTVMTNALPDYHAMLTSAMQVDSPNNGKTPQLILTTKSPPRRPFEPTLQEGVAKMAHCRQMTSLTLHPSGKHNVTMPDAQWMFQHWPRLHVIHGWQDGYDLNRGPTV
ncbi:hypothetical protein BGZ94_002848 [Podila epigama]|nr:hypothetical protein BGZ94_002848 [Podila epigama]